jgi:hypothetical protein
MPPRSCNRLTTGAVTAARGPQTLLMLERLIDHISAHDRVRRATFNEIGDDSLSRFLRSEEFGPVVFDQM